MIFMIGIERLNLCRNKIKTYTPLQTEKKSVIFFWSKLILRFVSKHFLWNVIVSFFQYAACSKRSEKQIHNKNMVVSYSQDHGTDQTSEAVIHRWSQYISNSLLIAPFFSLMIQIAKINRLRIVVETF